MMDSQKLQELLSGARLPRTGDRDDGTVKYHIFNSEGKSVYRSSYNSGLDIGFQYRSGISEDEFMSMINYLPELLAENAQLKEVADILKYCGFEVVTEPATGKHPARKVLRGAGCIYVPTLPEEEK